MQTIKRFKWWFLGGGAVLIAVIVIAGVVIYDRFNADTIELGETRGEFSFISDESGMWDLMLHTEDGEIINLTGDGGGADYFFSYVFQGTHINFYTNRSGEVSPAIVQTDGSGLETLTFMGAFATYVSNGFMDSDPAWSPDGTQMVWASIRDFNTELYLSGVDGSNETRLTKDGGGDTAPAWSPDGTRLTFVSDREGQQDVYVLDLASGDLTRLTDTAWDFQPVWSLDGDKILFARDVDDQLNADGTFTLYVMNADGTDLHPLGPDEVFEGDPTYSPYSGDMIFMSNETGNWHIYVESAESGDVRRITEGDANYMWPAWRPVPAGEDGEIVAAEAE